jgi:V8-like Glu-specific endopeptidase
MMLSAMTDVTCKDTTSRRTVRRTRTGLLLSAAALMMLAACVEETGGGGAASTATVSRAQVGDRSFYLQHHYVNDARALGDRAFAQIKAGDGPGASDSFARSTATLAAGLDQHRAYASQRADTQRAVAAIGMLAVGVAAVNASSDARAAARTPGDIARVNQSFSNFMQGFNNSTSFIGEQIRLGEINSTDANARFVDRDTWRSVVVSNDTIARSIVRIHNQTRNGHCTGFFVAPHLIATSAHCFQLGDALGAYRQNASNGRAFMTRDEEFFSISYLYENSLYDRSNNCDPHDIALLLTDRPSQHYLPISKNPVRPGQRIFGLGYSGDLNRGYFLRIDYGCKVTSVGTAGQIRHDCATFGGNSGGPIITASGGIAAIGVHSCGPRGNSGRADGRGAASVQRLEPMLAWMRTRSETQGRLAGAPY